MKIEELIKAAEAGDAVAQYELGLCYAIGLGVEKDYKEAVNWFTKSAKQGMADAMGWLGLCYVNGWGVEQDLDKASKLFSSVAEQRYTPAINALKKLGY